MTGRRALRHEARRLLRAHLRGQPRTLARLGGWALLEIVPTLVSGYAVARAIDGGFLAGRPAVGLAWLGAVLAGELIGAYATRQVIPQVGTVVEPLRDELVTRVVHASLRDAVDGAPVDTAAVARLGTQVEAARTALAATLLVLRTVAVTVCGALLGLLSLAPVTLLLAGPPVLAGVCGFAALLPRMLARQRTLNLAQERLAAATGAATAGLADIAACGARRQIRAVIEPRIDAEAAAARSVARAGMLRYLAVGVGGWLPLTTVVLAAPWLLRQGLTPGAVLGVLTYLTHAAQPAVNTLVNGAGTGGVQLTSSLERLVEATRGRQDPGPPVPGAAHGGPVGHAISVRDVAFGYAPGAVPVIQGLSLSVPQGDHVAVVGPSGAGKSTLLRLLAGRYRPACGRVLLGGVNLADLPAAEQARYRVLIPQHAYVFAGTLRENLCYLRPEATGPQLDEVVRRLGLEELRAGLGGYDGALVPDRLSAGERQLVAAARTYLAEAPVVLLDEATCHLDAEAEARVETAFAERPGTLVVVAHRLSSALRARHVLVLDGQRWWYGTHDHLVEASPVYRDLVGYWRGTAQAGPPTASGARPRPRIS